MARPSKYSTQRRAAIVRAIELGLSYEHAAAAADVHYDTLNEWRKTNPEFSEALKQAEGKAVLACLKRIQQAACKGAWQADAWVLERRYPEQYGRHARVNVEQHSTVDMRFLADLRAAVQAALPDDPEVQLRLAASLQQLADAQEAELNEGGAVE